MAKKNDFNVDEALDRLDEINNELAKPDISLNSAMELYKEGVTLSEECNDYLVGVETRLKEINAKGEVTESE